MLKWEASCFTIYRNREQAVKDNGYSAKSIKPIIGNVLFANSGKIAELEIFVPSFGLPFYIVELPSGECAIAAVRKISGEGYDFIDVLSAKRVARGAFCG